MKNILLKYVYIKLYDIVRYIIDILKLYNLLNCIQYYINYDNYIHL